MPVNWLRLHKLFSPYTDMNGYPGEASGLYQLLKIQPSVVVRCAASASRVCLACNVGNCTTQVFLTREWFVPPMAGAPAYATTFAKVVEKAGHWQCVCIAAYELGMMIRCADAK